MTSSLPETLVSVLALALLIAFLFISWRYAHLRHTMSERIDERFSAWKKSELAVAREQLEASVRAQLAPIFHGQLQTDLEAWRNRELTELRSTLESVAQQQAATALDQWKAEHESAMRADAVQRSYAVIRGRVQEQLAPYLPNFEFNPKDARFIGTPIDFIVFDGLAEDRCDRVVFVEVKTGVSSLTTRERRVRDAVREGRVEWQDLRIADESDDFAPTVPLVVVGPLPYAEAPDQ